MSQVNPECRSNFFSKVDGREREKKEERAANAASRMKRVVDARQSHPSLGSSSATPCDFDCRGRSDKDFFR